MGELDTKGRMNWEKEVRVINNVQVLDLKRVINTVPLVLYLTKEGHG